MWLSWRRVVAPVAALALAGVAVTWIAPGHRSQARAARTAAAPATAPLDPLTPGEIRSAITIVQMSGRAPRGALFPIVTLQEPPKAEVLAWKPGQPFSRRAYLQVFQPARNELFDGIVDLRSGSVTSWTPRPGEEPAVPYSDYGT